MSWTDELDPYYARLWSTFETGLASRTILDPRKRLLLTSWLTAEAARSWKPARPTAMQSLRHRRVRIIRDYGMLERREAPQFYPEVERAVPGVG